MSLAPLCHHFDAGRCRSCSWLGLPYGVEYDAVDLLGGGTYRWRGNRNYVDLAPWAASAHIFAIRPLGSSTPHQIEAT